jgi:hypothetical protein
MRDYIRFKEEICRIVLYLTRIHFKYKLKLITIIGKAALFEPQPSLEDTAKSLIRFSLL